MRSSISRDDLQILLHEADIAARRLVRQLRLPRADLDDVRQDLLVDLIARLPAYDAGRGTLGAFAGAILSNLATRIANKAKRERRMYGATPISLDEAIPESDGLTRGDLVADVDGLSSLFGQSVVRSPPPNTGSMSSAGLVCSNPPTALSAQPCPGPPSTALPRTAMAPAAASIAA